MKRIIFLVVMLAGAFLFAAEDGIDLLNKGGFQPVIMHGKPTAALGWYMSDQPRNQFYRKKNRYISGEDCFELDFVDGGMVIRFKEPLNICYETFPTQDIVIASRIGWPYPPAQKYHATGEVLLEKGRIRLHNGVWLEAKDGWQKFDVSNRSMMHGVAFKPVAGAKFGFRNFKCTAVYPKIGGEISLPDGGKLTKFLLPKDANYLQRYCISLWRGWFWRLTGVALPIEQVEKVAPTPGAFCAIPGKFPEGGSWKLDVNKEGIVLQYENEFCISSALFDFLRRKLNCSFYQVDTEKVPAQGSVKAIPAISLKMIPKYKHFTGDVRENVRQGGTCLGLYLSTNDCDYYHLPTPINDHVLNVMLPMELYFKDHPEYFMMDRRGKRIKNEYPLHTNPCFANPDAMKLMVNNLLDYAKGQTTAEILIFETGDAFTHCLCDKCVAFNGSPTINTESQFEFARIFAKELEKRHAKIKLVRSAYASRHAPPKKVRPVSPNLIYSYCLGHDVLPCTLHTDCEINRKGIAEIAAWSKLAGKPANMGYDTYRDIRPLQMARQAEFLRQYGTENLYMFYWKGFSPATPFVIGRWNLGEDPEKLMEEFDLNYYGNGGKYVHQVNLLVDKWTREYKHKPSDVPTPGTFRHFGVWTCDLGAQTLMDRPLLDKIYALFRQALVAAEKDNIKYRKHIAKELGFYLSEDLVKYNRRNCQSKAELQAFAKRLGWFVELARQYGSEFKVVLRDIPCRDFFISVSGIEVENTGKEWWQEVAIQRFMQNPMEAFVLKPEIIPAGLYIKPGVFKSKTPPDQYNYECPARVCIGLSRPSLKTDRASFTWNLSQKPAAPLQVGIEGLDDDKPGTCLLRVEVNGNCLFEGPVTFPEHSWGRMGFAIPVAMLKAGENTITLRNVTPDAPHRSARFQTQAEGGRDSQWGWIAISEMTIFDLSREFAEFANGKLKPGKTHWRRQPVKPEYEKMGPGEVIYGNGQVQIVSGNAPITTLAFFQNHWNPKVVVNSRCGARITVTASGSGKLRLGFWGYKPYSLDKVGLQMIEKGGYRSFRPNHWGNYYSKEMTLTDKPQTFTFECSKMSPSVGLIIPEIALIGKGRAVVTSFQLEPLPPSMKK